MSQGDKSAVAKENLEKGKKLAIVVIGAIYATINRFFSGLDVLPNLSTDDLNIGLFVVATGALIFGKGTAGAAAGLGALGGEIEKLIRGDPTADPVHLGTLMSASALGIGTWVTGFLGRKENTTPNTFGKIIWDREQGKKYLMDTLASLLGVVVVNNFLYVFGSQLQEGVPLVGGLPIFLANFAYESVVIIIFVPLTLILFDFNQVFSKKRDEIMEALMKKIDIKIPEQEGTRVISVTMPQRSLTVGLWSPIVLKFENTRDEETVFNIEAVSTSKIYPHKDKTAKMKPGEIWTQTFYALPSKQDEVSIRMRMTPSTSRRFKEAIREETIIEFSAKTRSQKSMLNTLLGFSGVNAGVLGLSVLWDKLVNFLADTDEFIQTIRDSWELLVATAVAEILLFIPILTGIFVVEKRKKEKAPLKLSFASDLDDQNYDEVIKKKLDEYIERYKEKLAPLTRYLTMLTSVVAVGYLGYEGVRIITDPTYVPKNPEFMIWGSVGVLASWILGMKGTELLYEFGLMKRSPYTMKKGNVIIGFKPLGQFQEGIPTEVVVKARNPKSDPGVRIKFEGFDTISPPMVELHLKQNEVAQFKIAVTPLKKETQDILALAYPLFTAEEEYIDAEEAEPYLTQELSYEVTGQTALGITKKQQNQLTKLGGFGGIIIGSLTYVSSFINIENFQELVRDNAPFIAGLQAPFIYGYYSITNWMRNYVSKSGGKS